MLTLSITVLITAALAQNAAPLPKTTLIKAGRVLDVRTGAYLKGQAVLVEGDTIKEVGPFQSISAHVSKDTTVLDLGEATLLPGLIDAHTHLLQNYDPKLDDDPNVLMTVSQMSPAARALLGAKMGKEDLMAGITTVRDVGNSGVNGDVALRDAISNGWVDGPRIIASTRALSAPGGQFGHLQKDAQNLVDLEYAVVTTPDEARRAVQQAFYDGADCIKVIVNTGPRIVSLETMKAIVEEAHRVHKKVAAYAIGDIATRIAAQAGVDSIEHAYTVPDDVLKLMAEKKIYLVPTDTYVEQVVQNTEGKISREDVAKMLKFQGDRLKRAIAAGVPIAAGSDEYYAIPRKDRGHSSLQVLQSYGDDGIAPADILRFATVNAADLLGMGDRIGSIEAGKLADIIAVNGDPLRDISVVQNVSFVMKGGSVFKNATKTTQ